MITAGAIGLGDIIRAHAQGVAATRITIAGFVPPTGDNSPDCHSSHDSMHRHPAARLAWCVFGAGAGIALALYLVGPPHATFVLASLGGSSVFLFGLTRAPAAQLRAILGGHLGGACIGIACAQFLGSSLLAYALAVSLSLAFMLATRTVHPPAGANPVIMVYAQAHWGALLNPVLLGVLCLVCVAMVWSRAYPGLVHYPVSPLEPSPPSLNWGGWQ